MSNPLIESCLAISRAGYEEGATPIVKVPYYHDTLDRLGTYLLSTEKKLKRVRCLPSSELKPDDDLAIMFGGGIDSFCALHKVLSEGLPKGRITVIHVDYGQPYRNAERMVFWKLVNLLEKVWRSDVRQLALTVNLIPEEHRKADLSWENYIIPARNLVLAAVGAEYASRVWIIANSRQDETVGARDKTKRFFRLASDIFSEFYGSRRVVESPFINKSKVEAVKEYINNGGSWDSLSRTFSCYHPVDGMHCGVCYACYKRYKLFQAFNEPHDFDTPPWEGSNFHTYQNKEKAKGR